MNGTKDGNAPRCLADCMLGTLAKRLRFIGIDTLYFNHIEDAALVELAVREKRIILTRDRNLVKRKAASRHILIETDDLDEQVEAVLDVLRVEAGKNTFPSRCIDCNYVLLERGKQDVIGKVPPFVFLKHRKFQYCPGCNKYYWRGTHWKNMEENREEREET